MQVRVSDCNGCTELGAYNVTDLPALSLGCCCSSQGALFSLSLAVLAQSFTLLLWLTPALLYSDSPSSEPAWLGELMDPSKFTQPTDVCRDISGRVWIGELR